MTFIWIFSRIYVTLDRNKFKSRMNKKLLIKMFINLIKTHHDGIIISQGETIILHNNEIHKIFDLDDD